MSGRVDEVQIIYPKFVNTLTQAPEIMQLLPIIPEAGRGEVQIRRRIQKKETLATIFLIISKHIKPIMPILLDFLN